MPGRASILNKDYMEGKAKGSLVGSQKELDLNKNNKIDKEDFSMLRDKKTSGGIMNIEDPSAGIPEVGEILQQKSAEDIKKLDTQMRLRQDDADRKSMELFPLKKLEELDRVKQEQEDKKAIEASRRPYQEGGSMLVPTEMEDMPVDTYTPEEQANAEATQLPDPKMEEQYLEFIVEESLQEEEQDYLMEALEKDPRLSEILDKVVMTASEFSGAGEVDGPGTGVSDSIPARLSDGEFVITEKATSMLGADNLQEMMDDAERMADGGVPMREKRQIGGMLGMPANPEEEELEDMSQMRSTDAEVNEAMLRSNQVPSLRRY